MSLCFVIGLQYDIGIWYYLIGGMLVQVGSMEWNGCFLSGILHGNICGILLPWIEWGAGGVSKPYGNEDSSIS